MKYAVRIDSQFLETWTGAEADVAYGLGAGAVPPGMREVSEDAYEQLKEFLVRGNEFIIYRVVKRSSAHLGRLISVEHYGKDGDGIDPVAYKHKHRGESIYHHTTVLVEQGKQAAE